ncbi:MAG: alpha/beta hydrolase [Desulfobulbaceae bacterium]|nr:MAG: alpha/beta hydrolase [Desulfobulbaceae bacterium]
MRYSNDKAERSISAGPWSGRDFFRCGLLGGMLLLWTFVCPAWSRAEPAIAYAPDSTPIAYEVRGTGEPTLMLVHGWSCDSRYWRRQVAVLAERHRVVTLDLAGHGHSGLNRDRYTMRSFGTDVKAVADAVGIRQLILVGHSMSGLVIAEAARLMPERVLGLIGVDTLENVEYRLTREELAQMTAPLYRDFRTGCRQFVAGMLLPLTDPPLREWIMADMAAAPPRVAMSAMEEMMALYISGEAARIFDAIEVPVVLVNADLWPLDEAANRRHMRSFEAIIVKGADHFLMLGRPADFNQALAKAVAIVREKSAK